MNQHTKNDPLRDPIRHTPIKIAIDIREAAKVNRVGKSWYAYSMVKNLLLFRRNDPTIHFTLFTDRRLPEFDHFQNATQRLVLGGTLTYHLRILKEVKKEHPDLYFAPTSYIVPALAPSWLKVVVTVHDLVAWLFPTRHKIKATIIERLALPRAIKRAMHFISVSENTKHDLRKFFDIASSKITVIPCGVNKNFRPHSEKNEPQIIESAQASSHATSHASFSHLPKNFLLAVGTLEPRKNHQLLIESFASLESKYPDLHLIIVGGKGWGYEPIFEAVTHHQLSGKVHFVGYASENELLEYYHRARALIFPSHYEGFGIPPLEAMKSGCPVICSRTSSLPEVVGDAAIFIDPSSQESLSHAIDRLLTDPKLSLELIQKGYKQSEKFSWEKSAQALGDLMIRLVKEEK